MKIKIIDLDGCIADDRWRRQLIGSASDAGRESPDWHGRFHAYHAASFGDSLANIEELWNFLRDDEKRLHEGGIVVCTGRPTAYASMTRQWLAKNGVYPLHIIHRNNDDHRPSHVVKCQQIEWLLSPSLGYDVRKEQIVEAIDDVQRVVDMYRDVFGIPSRLVRIGDEEHSNG